MNIIIREAILDDYEELCKVYAELVHFMVIYSNYKPLYG